MKMLMGIGNILRCDDGIGVFVSDNFSHQDWEAVSCGTAPENFTSVVRHKKPELLVLVDAADMNIPAGEFRVIPYEKIRDVGIGTHQLPLTHLIDYLSESAEEIMLIGIQPAFVTGGDEISEGVRAGALRLTEILKAGDLERISVL